MTNIRLTKEQRKDLRYLYDEALDDIWEIWQTSALKNLSIRLYDGVYTSLDINDNFIRLTNNRYIETLAYTKERFKKLVLIKNKDKKEDLMFEFIKQYESIREKLIKRLSVSEGIKKETDELFERLKNKFDKESTIEINLGNTNNQHIIEVSEENGIKIGIINFGNQSIKIITKGDITLVNKEEKQKTKKK